MTDSVPLTQPGEPTATAAANVKAFLRSLPGDPNGHTWHETSGFAGRFCSWCGVDEDDYDDPRREVPCSTMT